MTCCPDDKHLARLLEEQLDRDEQATIEKHLEGCGQCQDALEELTRERVDYSSTWRPWAIEPPPPSGEVDSGSPSSFDGLGSTFLRELERSSRTSWHPPSLSTNETTTGTSNLPLPRVSGYQILGRLGQGGMGIVYRARQRGLDRLVALKMIRAGSHAGPEHFTRFRIEVRSVARLKHPNVVQVYDVGEADGLPFVTLELLEGGSLEARVAGTPQPERSSAELLATLARAIASAHRVGVVHRDLKPANVLFHLDGTPKVTDFGLAKRLDEDDGQTHSGQVMGSPSFMAPEQARGQGRVVGPSADIYSLGAILYEMLTGRPPFKGVSPMETLFQVVHDEPAPPSQLRSGLSRDLETICLKCLSKEPDQRYVDADALADDLGRYLAGATVLARRVGPRERLWKWARRQPAAAALVVVALAGAIALATFGVRDYQASVLRNQAAAAHDRQVANRMIVGSGLLAEGRTALKEQKWDDGRKILEPFLDEIAADESMLELRGQVRSMLNEIEKGRVQQDRRNRDRERFGSFAKRRREAQIRDAQSAGSVMPGQTRATRAASLAAIEVFREARADSLAPEEQAEVASGRYEMHLILSEALSRALPGEDPGRQLQAALKVLDQAGQIRPPTRAFHLLRASYLARLGDKPGATRERLDAEAMTSTDALGHVLKGQDLARSQKLIAAIAEFEEALRLEPGQFRAQLLIAICQLQAGRYAEARVGLTACLQVAQDSSSLYELRGMACAEEGAIKQGHARESFPRPASLEAEAEGHFEAAEADYRKALEFRSGDVERYSILVNRGVLRVRSRRLEEAVDDLKAAVKLQPDAFAAYIPLGQAYQKQGRIDEAIEQFTSGLKIKPDLPALYRSRALVRIDRGKPTPEARDLALMDLSRAIQLEPAQSLEAAKDRARRARLLHIAGRFQEALDDCDEAIRIAPENSDALIIRVKSLLELKRFDEVISACSEAVARARPSAEIHELRGLARARRKDYSGAIQDYTQALVIDPNRPTALIHRGWAYIVCEAPVLAFSDFDEAIRLSPDSPEAYNGRGFAYILRGQIREAVLDADESLNRGGVPDARTTYNAARIYAKAVSVAEASRRGRGQQELADQYTEKAQSLIRLSMERLPPSERATFWREVVQGDPALDVIRRRPKFAQLAGQFGRPAQ